MRAHKPADFPYESHHIDVLGSTMHYVEHGTGDPVLFLHGQPTWSYLWRHVLPELEGEGRLIAVDLIGYGLSDRPAIEYEISDHIRYLEAFIDGLGLGLDRLTIAGHDWGSFFGLHYASRHPDKVRGLAFMEALLFPIAPSGIAGSCPIRRPPTSAPGCTIFRRIGHGRSERPSRTGRGAV